MAGDKRTAGDLGAWLCFEDESGRGLRPPQGRTWGRRGHTPVVRVTGGSNSPRLSLAALISVKPGQAPRLIYRTRARRNHGTAQRKGFAEADCAQLLDAAHQQLGGPLVVVWSHLQRSLANLTKHNITELATLVKTRLRCMQYRPRLLDGFLAKTGLDLTPM